MKKIAVFLAVLLLLAAPVLAAEPTEALSDVLGADELTQSLPDEAAEVLDGLSPDGTPDFRSGVRSIPNAHGRFLLQGGNQFFVFFDAQQSAGIFCKRSG